MARRMQERNKRRDTSSVSDHDSKMVAVYKKRLVPFQGAFTSEGVSDGRKGRRSRSQKRSADEIG